MLSILGGTYGMNPMTSVKKVIVSGQSLDISVKYRIISDDLVLFIHGLGCTKESFDGVWHHQLPVGISLLTLDLPGFGSSSKTTEFSYSMEDHAAVCEAVISFFPHRRYHIVAHSMGGAIGLLLSSKLMTSVKSFINVEGNLIAEDCGLISRETISVPYDIFEKKLFLDFKSRFGKRGIFGFSLDAAAPQAFYQTARSLVAWSDSGYLMERFKALTCKKVYVYGHRNSGLEVLSELGDISLIEIGGSGHFMMVDNPGEFFDKILTFIMRG